VVKCKQFGIVFYSLIVIENKNTPIMFLRKTKNRKRRRPHSDALTKAQRKPKMKMKKLDSRIGWQ